MRKHPRLPPPRRRDPPISARPAIHPPKAIAGPNFTWPLSGTPSAILRRVAPVARVSPQSLRLEASTMHSYGEVIPLRTVHRFRIA